MDTYRIIPVKVVGVTIGFGIQFKDKISILGFRIPVWRYVPDTYHERRFKRSQCLIRFKYYGILTLVSRFHARQWIESYPNVDDYLRTLESAHNEDSRIDTIIPNHSFSPDIGGTPAPEA